MPLNAALKQLIDTKLAHTREPQWKLPMAEVRSAFRNLWTPAITGPPLAIRRVENVSIPGADAAIPARMPEGLAQPDLDDGRLVRVLEDWCPPYSGYHLYYPSRRQSSPAFALVVDALRYRD
jgi:DNA-binding transcriptional LysR family regulator